MATPEPKDRSEALERSWPQTWAQGELLLQREFLQFLRVTAVNKLADVDAEKARATPLETSLVISLMGVIKHLTAVERFWISIVAGGLDVKDPWQDGDSAADFRLTEDDTPASVVQAYRDEWARSDEATAAMRAGDETKVLVGDKRRLCDGSTCT